MVLISFYWVDVVLDLATADLPLTPFWQSSEKLTRLYVRRTVDRNATMQRRRNEDGNQAQSMGIQFTVDSSCDSRVFLSDRRAAFKAANSERNCVRAHTDTQTAERRNAELFVQLVKELFTPNTNTTDEVKRSS